MKGQDKRYGIYSYSESEIPGGVMFWNNRTGWNGYTAATRFTREEKRRLNLPMSKGNDAAWFEF